MSDGDAILRRAAQRASENGSSVPTPPTDPFDFDREPTAAEVARARSRLQHAKADDAARGLSVSSWEPVDLGPVLRGERITSPPTVLTRDDGVPLLYPGRLNLFIGETESLKSWGAFIGAKQELALGHHVVIVDFEDTAEAAVERLVALGATRDQIATNLSYIGPDGRFDEVAEMVVEDRIARRGPPTLVVIDGVTEAMAQVGLDPNKGPDVAGFYSGFPRWLARTGAAVVLIDHVTKSTEHRGRWAVGSERKLSGLDGAAYTFDALVSFGRGRTGRVKISVSKDRGGHIRQHEGAGKAIAMMELVSWPDDGITTTLSIPETSSGSFRPTILMERLSDAIGANPGLTSRALREAVGGSNDAKGLALELLVTEGFVEVGQGPNRSRVHTLRRPFRADDSTVDGDSDDY